MLGQLPPFHHGGPTDPDANLVQRFVDSDGGIVLGSFLHTTGALLFTAGIILYIYQARLLQAAQKSSALPSLKVLPLAHGFNLIGISLNGMGGLMRLYQSDHPGLEQVTTSAWVQILLVKHLFLMAGVGLAVFLTYRTHTLSLADDAPKSLFPEAERIQWVAVASFVTILLASIMGAAASNALPTAAPMPAAAMGDEHLAHGAAAFRYANVTGGRIAGNPVQPTREAVTLDVPADGFEIWAELTWTNSQAVTLQLEVRNPDGQGVQGQRSSSAGKIVFTLAESLKPGSWSVGVVGQNPVEVAYELSSRVAYGTPALIFEMTTTIPAKPAGQAANSFREIDLKVTLGDHFRYSWELVGSTQAIPFNMHLHFGSEEVYPVKGTWTSYGGEYTHNETRTNAVSLLWENPHASAVKVHFRIVGNFTVDRAPTG